MTAMGKPTMNLLVTGGAGFVGCNLIAYLTQQPEVARIVNLDCLTYAGHLANTAAFRDHPRYVFEKVDLRDQGEVRRVVQQHAITHVMHLAAESHVDRSIVGPGDFIHTNIVGTYHLLEACREAWSRTPGEHRFHQVSTDEVYGSLGPTGYFTEATPYAPSSPYSASKASADMLVQSYHKTYGLPVVITNCSNNYGPFQFPEKLIPVAIQCLLEHKPIPIYGDGQNVRDWLYVGDHVAALWQVLQRGRNGATYNIGGSNECSNLDLIGLICDLFDQLQVQPGGASRQLMSFVRDRPGHDRRYAVDAALVRRELGWRPQHTLSDGLRETVVWYLRNRSWLEAIRRGHCDS